MVIQCAFTNCTNKPHSWAPQSFHKFPFRDPERTQLWLLAAGLDINTPAETLLKWRLCSDHFRPDDFAKPRNLKDHTLLTKSAVPSVFPDALSVLRQCIPTRTGTVRWIQPIPHHRLKNQTHRNDLSNVSCSLRRLIQFIRALYSAYVAMTAAGK